MDLCDGIANFQRVEQMRRDGWDHWRIEEEQAYQEGVQRRLDRGGALLMMKRTGACLDFFSWYVTVLPRVFIGLFFDAVTLPFHAAGHKMAVNTRWSPADAIPGVVSSAAEVELLGVQRGALGPARKGVDALRTATAGAEIVDGVNNVRQAIKGGEGAR